MIAGKPMDWNILDVWLGLIYADVKIQLHIYHKQSGQQFVINNSLYTFLSLLVIVCTTKCYAIRFHVLPTEFICVFWMDMMDLRKKQRLFPYTALTDLFLKQRFNPLQPSGHYMYRQFNIQQFYVLPTQCIYVFCVDLRTNSVYFPIQH